MKEETLLPCPFCGGEPEEEGGTFVEYYGHERQDYSITCKQCGAEVRCEVGDFEGADAVCSCHHNTRKICSDKWNRRTLQPGNSGQPVTVPAGYVLVSADFIDTVKQAFKEVGDRKSFPHHSHDVPGVWDSDNGEKANKPCAQCALWSKLHDMLAAAPKTAGNQLTPTPEDRLQKAIVDSCMVFLHGCDSLSKNYECDFSDSETELSFCIANVAKKIGVVEETGNRRWSLSQQMKEEINGVYRKYAMRIMEAAPKVTP